jgi:hypothetical protein
MKKFVKLTIFLVATVFYIVFFSTSVKAADVYTRDDLQIDDGLSDQSQNEYGYVDGIVISSITVGDDVSFGRGDEWMKGLYYYMITHLNFLDVPFNYIISWQGDVFSGKGGDIEVKSPADFQLSKDYVNPILLVYFDNGKGLTNQGKDGLADFVSDIVSTYDLPVEDVISGNLSFSSVQEGQISTVSVSPSDSGYLFDWLSEWKTEYVKTDGLALDLSGSIESVSVPEEIGAGETFSVKVVAENIGNVPWYNTGAHATFIGTSEERDRNSDLYIADVWSSFARVVAPTEELVLPGEQGTFEFTARAPVIPGTYSESFELIRLGNGWLSNTQFKLDLNVVKGNLDVVEILDTETGFLNVRACAGLSCEEVGTVEPGYKTVVTEKSGSWYKIIYDGANEGWVYSKYVKEL